MEKLISCAFNMDTACVELHFTDGSIYSINCTAVENEAADNRFQRAELAAWNEKKDAEDAREHERQMA